MLIKLHSENAVVTVTQVVDANDDGPVTSVLKIG
jgi:hypothetical protein